MSSYIYASEFFWTFNSTMRMLTGHCKLESCSIGWLAKNIANVVSFWCQLLAPARPLNKWTRMFSHLGTQREAESSRDPCKGECHEWPHEGVDDLRVFGLTLNRGPALWWPVEYVKFVWLRERLKQPLQCFIFVSNQLLWYKTMFYCIVPLYSSFRSITNITSVPIMVMPKCVWFEHLIY